MRSLASMLPTVSVSNPRLKRFRGPLIRMFDGCRIGLRRDGGITGWGLTGRIPRPLFPLRPRRFILGHHLLARMAQVDENRGTFSVS